MKDLQIYEAVEVKGNFETIKWNDYSTVHH